MPAVSNQWKLQAPEKEEMLQGKLEKRPPPPPPPPPPPKKKREKSQQQNPNNFEARRCYIQLHPVALCSAYLPVPNKPNGFCDHVYLVTCSMPHIVQDWTVWESRWPSWAFRPNEPSGFRGCKASIEPCFGTGLSRLVPNSVICQPATSEDIQQHNSSSSMLRQSSAEG